MYAKIIIMSQIQLLVFTHHHVLLNFFNHANFISATFSIFSTKLDLIGSVATWCILHTNEMVWSAKFTATANYFEVLSLSPFSAMILNLSCHKLS